jgi:pyochelin biosynthetic protein PchC
LTETTVREQLWIRDLRTDRGGATTLLCFPHAGGSVSSFRPLAAAVPSDIDMVGVQYPGRQDRRREPAIADLGRLADEITAVLSQEWTSTPYAFFGHSMGAVVAFEVALRLRSLGRPGPFALFASGRRAPSRHRAETVHQLDDAGLVAEISSLSGTEPSLLEDPDVRAMVLPPLRADYRAIETYRMADAATPLDVPISALIGERDPRVTREEAQAWCEHTTGPFQLHQCPDGDHFYLSRFPEWTADRITSGIAVHS